MYCTNPGFIVGKGFVPCRKCQACIISKKKEWSDRLIIESTYWPHKYFVTLTYAPEHMPSDMSVSRHHINLWKKRLGYYCGHVPQLYYCAEYGSQSDLPHYHAAIFSEENIFDKILQSWDFGRISVDNLSTGRCNYIAGYVTKKLDIPNRTDGRCDEFHGASRRPALGYRLLYEILEKMTEDDGFRERMLRHVYPPYTVQIAGKTIRLPPYIRNKLSLVWKLYNAEKQEAYKLQKFKTEVEILKQIKKNLQKLHLLEPDDEIIHVTIGGLDKYVQPMNRLSWKQCKAASRDLRESQEERNRKAYNIKHRRL